MTTGREVADGIARRHEILLEFRVALAADIEAALDARWREGVEAGAKVADGFTCGVCGMDGKASAAIRALIPKEGK